MYTMQLITITSKVNTNNKPNNKTIPKSKNTVVLLGTTIFFIE